MRRQRDSSKGRCRCALGQPHPAGGAIWRALGALRRHEKTRVFLTVEKMMEPAKQDWRAWVPEFPARSVSERVFPMGGSAGAGSSPCWMTRLPGRGGGGTLSTGSGGECRKSGGGGRNHKWTSRRESHVRGGENQTRTAWVSRSFCSPRSPPPPPWPSRATYRAGKERWSHSTPLSHCQRPAWIRSELGEGRTLEGRSSLEFWSIC